VSTLRVRVHRDRCLATAACVYTAPGVFEVGDDAVVAVVGDPEANPQAVRDAVAECPVAALELVED
jgi:ferredoxin